MRTSIRRRGLALATVALATAALTVGTAAGAAATVTATARAAAAPAASTTHPYSDPLYYPLRHSVWMNCVRTNPGCTSHKTFWSIDEVVATKGLRVGVYAMGAGIVHIQTAHGASCPASPTSFGTSIWIDHGAGVVSRYGHFSRLSVKNGQHVAVGQLLGTTGTTGKGANCSNTYLDYEVLHHGVKGSSYEIKTLRACSSGKTSSWPTALNSKWTSWNKVPMKPVRLLPGAASSCLPGGAPATPNKPSGLTLRRSGSSAITVSWARASNITGFVIQVGAYSHGVLPPVQKLRYITVSSKTRTSYRVTGLHNGTKYGFKLNFHNSAGYSRPSSTYAATPSA